MRRVLILFAHPVLERSRVNRRLEAEARDVPGVTIHDLYEAYPTLEIDASREQKLRGKITLNAITTGGPESSYHREGYNRFTLRELLAPWDQTAHLCGMRFLA